MAKSQKKKSQKKRGRCIERPLDACGRKSERVSPVRSGSPSKKPSPSFKKQKRRLKRSLHRNQRLRVRLHRMKKLNQELQKKVSDKDKIIEALLGHRPQTSDVSIDRSTTVQVQNGAGDKSQTLNMPIKQASDGKTAAAAAVKKEKNAK